MQNAFRGHIVVLCDQETASDGEAFTEGFKHFEMGKVIGIRTWGGEIWLSGSNVQADGGVATAAETGVYSEDGKWLIEGHGVDPDIVVEQDPIQVLAGHDPQLERGIAELMQRLPAKPVGLPERPAAPIKTPAP
jgi:tricorn protease